MKSKNKWFEIDIKLLNKYHEPNEGLPGCSAEKYKEFVMKRALDQIKKE